MMTKQFKDLAEGEQFHFNGYCWMKYSSFQAICTTLLGIYQFAQTDYVRLA